jgi:hypothetical protein
MMELAASFCSPYLAFLVQLRRLGKPRIEPRARSRAHGKHVRRISGAKTLVRTTEMKSLPNFPAIGLAHL